MDSYCFNHILVYIVIKSQGATNRVVRGGGERIYGHLQIPHVFLRQLKLRREFPYCKIVAVYSTRFVFLFGEVYFCGCMNPFTQRMYVSLTSAYLIL